MGSKMLVLTPQLFSVLDCIDWYLTFFGVVCFRCKLNDGNELQVWERLRERGNMDVADWAKNWDQWGSVVPLTVALMVKRRIRCLCNVMRRWIINADWLSRFFGCVSRLTVSAINLIWITLFWQRRLTTCCSSIIRNTGHTIVTLKCRCILIVNCLRHFLGGLTLECSRSCLVIARRCM